VTRGSQGGDYPGCGATRGDPGAWPTGFRRLRVSVPVGRGAGDFAAAGEALATWRMHRAMGVRFGTEALRAARGVDVLVGLGVGPLRVHAPCRLVWTEDGPRRTGWAYGTLPGHPVRGEEAFLVVRHEDGTVRLEVRAFSRPEAWYTVAAGPLLPLFQRSYARRCGRVLRRLVREERRVRTGREESRAERTDQP
jgi:uncharacterized protein (UPF0548 family)